MNGSSSEALAPYALPAIVDNAPRGTPHWCFLDTVEQKETNNQQVELNDLIGHFE
ncbi:hypothetical protein QG37_06693 [Candidozyma auris]|uniref:Uncharacterized protein n=1 Tax=Candidozyma auris TaxID=498019 RepID=A0A0L0NSH8_CANAR|nr:hypothetical protein QG37_06693 [[Candida] auris]